ncbi:reverse transcriptase domain-containing protein [Artemisia annua]|uniref:Reverse transcriptase domain-containing protein n=1 Tax=Artemisia annua TaxID=35608 RepID=A0A2U1L844_ARTAN|nr:reverse transcriptase domain-containing protein [Artemisia annua]
MGELLMLLGMMRLLPQLGDPQSSSSCFGHCMGIAKLFFGLRSVNCVTRRRRLCFLTQGLREADRNFSGFGGLILGFPVEALPYLFGLVVGFIFVAVGGSRTLLWPL